MTRMTALTTLALSCLAAPVLAFEIGHTGPRWCPNPDGDGGYLAPACHEWNLDNQVAIGAPINPGVGVDVSDSQRGQPVEEEETETEE